jgi:hypothetical protein
MKRKSTICGILSSRGYERTKMHAPEFRGLFRIHLFCQDLLPDLQVIIKEECLPPITHGMASFTTASDFTCLICPADATFESLAIATASRHGAAFGPAIWWLTP